MENEQPPIDFYTKDEIEKLINNNTPLYFADTGIEEVIVREDDIADFIMKANEVYKESVDLKFIKVDAGTFEPSLTTYGIFLNKADPELREKIIDRLMTLQTTDEPIKDFKIIDEDDFEIVQSYLGIDDEIDFSISDEKENKPVGVLHFHLATNYTEYVEYFNEQEMLNAYKEQLRIASPQGIDYKVYEKEDSRRDGLEYAIREALYGEYGKDYTKNDYKKDIENKVESKEAR